MIGVIPFASSFPTTVSVAEPPSMRTIFAPSDTSWPISKSWSVDERYASLQPFAVPYFGQPEVDVVGGGGGGGEEVVLLTVTDDEARASSTLFESYAIARSVWPPFASAVVSSVPLGSPLYWYGACCSVHFFTPSTRKSTRTIPKPVALAVQTTEPLIVEPLT